MKMAAPKGGLCGAKDAKSSLFSIIPRMYRVGILFYDLRLMWIIQSSQGKLFVQERGVIGLSDPLKLVL